MPGDEFYVEVEPVRLSKLKFGFKQKIFRKRDNKLAIDALVVGTSLNAKGRPFVSEDIERVFPFIETA